MRDGEEDRGRRGRRREANLWAGRGLRKACSLGARRWELWGIKEAGLLPKLPGEDAGKGGVSPGCLLLAQLS